VKNPSFYQTTLWALALLLAACQPARLLATTSTLRPTPSPSHTATVLPSRTPTIIPTLTATASVDLSPAPTIIAENNNGNGPLHFVFPTQAARPISAWRPPLYDVPWAMTPNDHFFFTRPIAADEVNWPQANYRYGNPYPGLDNVFHTGIDIEAPLGTPVIATAPGKVVWAGEGLMYGAGIPEDPYGLAVAISHDFGYRGKHVETIYAHMSRVDVVVGQRVAWSVSLA
jgi:murein DD-endopeptidase MepM/ murein hydrolase activator NlpD